MLLYWYVNIAPLDPPPTHYTPHCILQNFFCEDCFAFRKILSLRTPHPFQAFQAFLSTL
jgi:hypothetical protein